MRIRYLTAIYYLLCGFPVLCGASDFSLDDKNSKKTNPTYRVKTVQTKDAGEHHPSSESSPFVLIVEIVNSVAGELHHLFQMKIPRIKKDSKYDGTTNQLHTFQPVIQNLQQIGNP